MSGRAALVATAAAVCAFAVGIGGAAADPAAAPGGKIPPPPPMPPPSDFVDEVDNPYFPLEPGTTFVYRGTSDGEPQRERAVVTYETKEILGVRATVVLDLVTRNGRPEEKTFDWYAQDKDGNVWYLGEDSFDWKNGKWERNDGSWEAGVDGARAGLIMEAGPKEGDVYRQEYYEGHAEDVARVLNTDTSVSVPYGDFDHALKTREWTPLQPGVVEHKYYARGVGDVKVLMVKGGQEEMELVDVKRDG